MNFRELDPTVKPDGHEHKFERTREKRRPQMKPGRHKCDRWELLLKREEMVYLW
jgi:hypothetical protein